jgi:hypothetical protein
VALIASGTHNHSEEYKMPFQKMYCADPGCRWHTESKGGEFVFSAERGGFYCPECFRAGPPVMNSAKNLWDFTTTHFNGEKIHVRDAAHLQRLEKQFGVSNQAFHNDHAHWDIPPSSRPEPMNAELARFIGKASEMGRMDKGSRVSGEWQR